MIDTLIIRYEESRNIVNANFDNLFEIINKLSDELKFVYQRIERIERIEERLNCLANEVNRIDNERIQDFFC